MTRLVLVLMAALTFVSVVVLGFVLALNAGPQRQAAGPERAAPAPPPGTMPAEGR